MGLRSLSRIFRSRVCCLVGLLILLVSNSTQLFAQEAVPDSTQAALQATNKKSKISKDALTDPLKYDARDSIKFQVDSQVVYLFGEAVVTYGDIKLKSAFIRLDMKNNLVDALPMPDSSGKLNGFPEFSDGNQQFKAGKMKYNIKTKKGKIYDVDTQEGEGYLHGEAVKKDSSNVVYMSSGRYTTCNLDEPHYHFALKKLKVIPEDKIITGPANLVVGGVPTPLAIPFGFFPNQKGRSSGIILPQYGEAANIGFFLKDGGYYWGINDFVDLTLQGDIYTRGSYALRGRSNYNNRYHYSGGLEMNYANIRVGEEGFPNYQLNRDFFVRWRHTQDAKANPYNRFAADVNMGTSNYNSLNSANTGDLLSNTFQSTVRFDRSFPTLPLNLNISARQAQNTRNRTMDIILPEANLLMSRIFLFRPKNFAGTPAWWQNIGISYSGRITNQLNTTDTSLFGGLVDWRRELKNGLNHQIPLTTQLSVFKYLTLSPGLTYTESWYLQSIRKRFDEDLRAVRTDTLRGFAANREMNLNATVRTVLYGMYVFKGGPIKAIRHAMTPSAGMVYTPMLSALPEVQSDSAGTRVKYSPFEGSLYGPGNIRERALLNYSLVNNIEMKVKSASDTVTGTKKVKLFDNISLSGNYDLMADSFQFSAIDINARCQPLPIVFFNFNASANPYRLDPVSGRVLNELLVEYDNKWARLTTASFAMGLNLRSKQGTPANQSARVSQEEIDAVNANRDLYVDFNIPWTLNLSYNYILSRPAFSSTITQAISASGDINVTQKWKVGVNTGYDVIARQFTFTSINVYRDLHCWEMRFNFVPFGLRKSYSLDINVKASVLQELKLSRKRDWYDLR